MLLPQAITAGFSDDLSQITAEAQKQLRKDGINNEKIINDPSAIVEEMLAGLVASYPQLIHQVEDSRVVAKTPPTNKSWLSLRRRQRTRTSTRWV